MCFSKIPKFDPSEACTGGFTGPMGGKWVVGVVFRPKPPPEPIFTKIGLGHRTGPYIRLLHFLVFGLLRVFTVFLRSACGVDSYESHLLTNSTAS